MNFYIYRLSFFTFVISLFFRLVGIKVYYYYDSPFYRHNRIKKILETLGLVALDFEYIQRDTEYIWRKNFINYSSYISEKFIFPNKFYRTISNHYAPNVKMRKFEVCMSSGIDSALDVIIKILIFKNFHKKKWNIIWISRNVFNQAAIAQDMSQSAFRIVNINPFNSFYFQNLKRVLHLFSHKLSKSFYGKSKSNATSDVQESREKNTKVIYFPHQGVWYGNMFLKDHFYKKNDDMFDPENICHLGIGDDPNQIKKSLDFYERNNIPYGDIKNQGGVSWLNFLRKIFELKLFYSIFLKIITFRFNDLDFYIFEKFYSIESYIVRMKRHDEAKIALVGYDMLFPAPLAVALDYLKIETVGVQERFIATWCDLGSIIIDRYFVQGQIVMKVLKEKEKINCIQQVYVSGPVRRIKSQEADLSSEIKYQNIKQHKKLILVLDYHPEPDATSNRLQINNNWKLNRHFYLDIIKLATENQDCHFFIKGKNLDVLDHPAFIDIVESVSKISNLEFETNLQLYTPFLSARLCDGAVALHTSLGDELLSMNKPVIFHDLMGVPGKYFDYMDLNIISTNYNELAQLFDSLKKGTLLKGKEETLKFLYSPVNIDLIQTIKSSMLT